MSSPLSSNKDRDVTVPPAATPDLRLARRVDVLDELQRALDATRVAAAAHQAAPVQPELDEGQPAERKSAPPPLRSRYAPPAVRRMQAAAAELEAALQPRPSLSAMPDSEAQTPSPLQGLGSIAAGASAETREHPELPSAPAFMRMARPRPERVHPQSALVPNRPVQDGSGGLRMAESVEQDDELLRRIVQRQQAPWQESDGAKAAQRRRIAIVGFAAAPLAAGFLAFLIYQFVGARAPDVPATTALSSSFPKSTGERATEKNAPKLVLSAVSGLASQPVALGVNIDAATPDSSILIRGLQPGSRVTAGFTAGDGAWRVPMRELPQAAIVPPPDFVGTMQLAVDLRRSDDSVVDTDVQRIIWSAVGSSLAVAAPVKTAMMAAPQDVFPPPPAPRASAGAPQTIGSGASSLDDPQRGENARLPGSRRLDQEEVQNLVQRGDAALKSGDIAAARLLLRRAAEAADMRAAMALAATYDPGVLTQLRAMGANADVGTARQWYQKAADWGSPDARRRLQELGQQ